MNLFLCFLFHQQQKQNVFPTQKNIYQDADFISSI